MKKINVPQPKWGWRQLSPKFLPFADAATPELPLPRLLRLSMFQWSVGLAMVLLVGTLNRVMVVELGVPTWLVALMVSLPILFAPFRALLGFRSDVHPSFIGWRRVPYMWFGNLMQFGGLAIMPWALFLLAHDTTNILAGYFGGAVAFFLVGAGLHTTQTAGLALAADLAPPKVQPRVVALLYVMLLIGMVGSAMILSALLEDFSYRRLAQVVSGAAVATMILNLIALWKQEPRNPSRTHPSKERPSFMQAWREFTQGGQATKLLIALGLGTAGFQMQDILLEPYGGQVLHLSVSGTTFLTALLAGGTLVACGLAAHLLGRGVDPFQMSAFGGVAGVMAFIVILLSAPTHSLLMFRIGTTLIGFGAGLFMVGTLVAAMGMAREGYSGLALGAWGAVQATASGVAIAVGGAVRDFISGFAMQGALGQGLTSVFTGYGFVYFLEILLLFAAIIVIGPLTHSLREDRSESSKFGLAELPG
ncbi:arabinose efflux permease family protein [Thioflavicoccus mobilis 8321]|uniref:Arabinose efflux permease family protein n=1 Tax=Thioflavicoccus mobilis 8321 TaxID=765912 RepID=L0H0F9_9GAMM|nr:BCD family MFS transporter [Thioflavicoccus mobilis]AGA91711.1 arabinose efflux permease family protein [Thioflavicoccus mobilis 8321]